MGWAVGQHNGRDIGYGVPAICDHPACNAEINRGLGYVCGGDVYGGDEGCGLFFCGEHRYPKLCNRCHQHKEPYEPKPDIQEWIDWKLTDESWEQWRQENPEKVVELKSRSSYHFCVIGDNMKRLVTLLGCWLLDHHTVPKSANIKGQGDAYDYFGKCIHCKRICHKDTHMYGHSGWKKLSS